MTFGRWEPRLRGNNPKFIDIMQVGAADSSGAIARVPLRDGFFDQANQDANLIAAAPALLAALQSVVEWGAPMADAPKSSRPLWFDTARSIIAKAKGGA